MDLTATRRQLEAMLGERVHTSAWQTLTQDRIQRFADATDDHQWIHVDCERAVSESPYGATIAHGYLCLSLLTHLRGVLDADPSPFPGVQRIINYGSDRVRYPDAVRSGDRIRACFDLLRVEEVKGNALQIVERATVEVEGREKPACVAEIILRLYF